MVVQETLSGWRALGWLGGLVLGLAIVALAWAGLVRRKPVSALWLVLAGGLALVVVMAVTVNRVGGHGATTTAPSAGLAVAYGGALAIILVGLVVLVQETRRRTQERG